MFVAFYLRAGVRWGPRLHLVAGVCVTSLILPSFYLVFWSWRVLFGLDSVGRGKWPRAIVCFFFKGFDAG